MAETLTTIWNVLLIVVGFGLVIFIHELGHFAAAKWAGVRVHAFAIGFGPAIASWRKGIGFRAGSSEPEYIRRAAAKLVRDREADRADDLATIDAGSVLVRAPRLLPGVSPTEYRLNWFPLGGYVKMLGQEDANPNAVSHEADSFMVKPVFKRMVIISAGVIANIILAAVLFVVVFLAGMKEMAPIVGDIAPNSPAERGGLRRGDIITHIGGERMSAFSDVGIATAMSKRGTPMELTVQRGGETLAVNVTPEISEATGFLQMGVGPAASAALAEPGKTDAERDDLRRFFERAGLASVEPGSTLVAVGGTPVAPVTIDPFGRAGMTQSIALAAELESAMESAAGAPVSATFRSASGTEQTMSLVARPKFETYAAAFENASGEIEGVHLLGFTPLMTVEETQEGAKDAGLQAGDVFARIADVDWPDAATGIARIREHAGRAVSVRVLRAGAFVDLSLPVKSNGLVGFNRGTTAEDSSLITRFPADDVERASANRSANSGGLRKIFVHPAQRLNPPVLAPMRIESVAGTPVTNFTKIRAALIAATPDWARATSPVSVEFEIALLDGTTMEPRGRERVSVELTLAELQHLHTLGWSADRVSVCFQPAPVMLKTNSPVHALTLGVQRTHRAVLQTYLTFARLFQGTVRVEHLKGPVGIAHIGSQFASQGFIYVLFFLALISANLAVINFLPIPIVDGGLMVFLIIEAITRKPVSILVQNIATMIGLVLIGTMFIVVTFNDVRALLFG